MELKDLLSDPDLGAAQFSIVRKTWSHESGLPQLIDSEEIHAGGTVHPADPSRLDLLPEESRHKDIVLIHSTEPLSLGDQEGGVWVSPDEIHFDSKVYRVFQVRPWQAFGFWKGWAVEV